MISLHDQAKFSLIALGGGLLLILVGLWLTLGSLYSQSTWQPTQATVIQAGTSRSTSSSRRGRRTRSYLFRYSYYVDGKHYIGQSIDHGILSEMIGVSKRLAGNKYPEGTEIEVFYDPQLPCLSVLYNGMCVEGPFEMIFGCLLVIGGIVNLQRIKGIKLPPSNTSVNSQSMIDETIDNGCRERETAIQEWLDRTAGNSNVPEKEKVAGA